MAFSLYNKDYLFFAFAYNGNERTRVYIQAF